MKKNKKNTVVGIVITTLILIFLVAVSNTKIEKISQIGNPFTNFVNSIQNSMVYLKNKVAGNDSFFLNIEEMKQENERLKKENSELEQSLRELEILKAENSTLKEYVNLTDKYTEYTTHPAYVIQSDIGNYSIEYKMHGLINHTSPSDLVNQLKDGINASDCHAESVSVIMPLLYNGRQHRKKAREPLSCGATLREIDNMPRIKNFITFDAHDQGVEHATYNMEFQNYFVSNIILEKFINDVNIEELKDIVFVAPDSGANYRRDIYLNSFNYDSVKRDAGGFYKVRDYNHFVDGKYPVISHEYIGHSKLNGKTAIIVDDMISSGGSMIDTIDELHKRGVKHIYVMVTFGLFTKGVDDFRKYHEDGILDGVYVSNLSYINDEYKKEQWLHICDASEYIAKIIYELHNNLSLTSTLSDRSLPIKLLERKFNQNK